MWSYISLPETLDEHVADRASHLVYRDRHVGFFQDLGEVLGRELPGFNRFGRIETYKASGDIESMVSCLKELELR
jgi:hypothetical protein